jgi:hypothetical protein
VGVRRSFGCDAGTLSSYLLFQKWDLTRPALLSPVFEATGGTSVPINRYNGWHWTSKFNPTNGFSTLAMAMLAAVFASWQGNEITNKPRLASCVDPVKSATAKTSTF